MIETKPRDDTPAIPTLPASKCTPVRLFRAWFGAIAFVVCSISCYVAWISSGWGSLGMLVYILPLTHLTLLLLGVLAAFITRFYHSQTKLGPMIGLALGLSVLSWGIATIVCIQSPGFHSGGC